MNTENAVLENQENKEEVVLNKDKKTDIRLFDPRSIGVNPNNRRVINIEDADMQELIASIRANGIITPLMVKPNPDFGKVEGAPERVTYAGNRRITAVHYLINVEGIDIKYVPCQFKAHVSFESELLTQIVENSGKPFTLLEKAEVIRSLIEVCSYTPAEVSEKTGEATSNISNMLKIAGFSKKQKQMISDNDVSAHLALSISRKSKTVEEFDAKMEELFKAAEELKASGKKKENSKHATVTAKKTNVVAKTEAKDILANVCLKLEKDGVKGENVDLLYKVTQLLRKPTDTVVEDIYKLYTEQA